jgi:hypothetical protein
MLTQQARVAPMNMGQIRSTLFSSQGTAMGKKRAFPAVNVADEMAVCIKFCLCRLEKFLRKVRGILATRMAINAPIIEVFVVMPNLLISSKPMITPNRLTSRFITRVFGSNADGCLFGIFNLFYN